VAIGFINPQRTGTDRYVFSSHDMHAWPEVYFRGSGWVRFEPTPATRTGAAPGYTTGAILKPGDAGPSDGASTKGGHNTSDPTSAAPSKAPHNQTSDSTTSSSGGHVPWGPVLVGVLLLAMLALAGYLPGAVRRSRRERRLQGGAEAAWAELRDSAVDLRVPWPAGRSPQETGHLLSAWFGPEPDGAPLVRPPRGRGLAPGAEDALGRMVDRLERVRYARYADDSPGALAEDARTVIAALEHGCTRGTLRAARWLPRSFFDRTASTGSTGPMREPEAVGVGGVVDHVG
jgi:hypothetical protein